MAAIGSLVFCTDCGNLLDSFSGDAKAMLSCDVCGALNKGLCEARLLKRDDMSSMDSHQPHRHLIKDCDYQI